MKLHIENFAKISSADLEFDGLTVVAGDNNTGKSTVGKVLYAIFRALSQLDKRVFRDRIQTIQRAFRQATNLKLDDVRAKRFMMRLEKIACPMTNSNCYSWLLLKRRNCLTLLRKI